jgi:ribosomal-protein-alanine N-acetyltransferase
MLLEQRLRSRRGVRIVERPSGPFGVQLIPTRRVTGDEVRDAIARVPKTDRAIVTSALTPVESTPFVENGFVERERLHLLRHTLAPATTSSAPSTSIRKARRGDLSDVLEIDRQSFDDFWRLNAAGIAGARRATPRNRYAVATRDGEIVGYAIVGRADTVAFLQRLAIHPDERRAGTARQLVADGVSWARKHGCRYMLVNTQTSNVGAFEFYKAVGFRPETHHLTVYEWHS